MNQQGLESIRIKRGAVTMRRCRRRLVESRVTITGTVDHGIAYGIYFLDPDGHQLEVFCQRTKPDEDQNQAFRAVGVEAIPIEPESAGSQRPGLGDPN